MKINAKKLEVAKTEAPLTFKKRRNSFESSTGNCTFSLDDCRAYSYRWWRFVDYRKELGGLVFNNYTYSSSTSKHQSKVRRLIGLLGLKVVAHIEAPRGLDDMSVAIKHYYDKLFTLEAEMRNPRRKKSLDSYRESQHVAIHDKIKLVKRLGGRISKADIETIANDVEDSVIHKFIRAQEKIAARESLDHLIVLSGDGMTNLDKMGLEFVGIGLDQWGVEVNEQDLKNFRILNGLSVSYDKTLYSYDNETNERENWGRVERVKHPELPRE